MACRDSSSICKKLYVFISQFNQSRGLMVNTGDGGIKSSRHVVVLSSAKN